VQEILSARIPVAIGRISYSLYLWHWPIYVYMAYYAAGEIGWIGRGIALVLTFILAALSLRFVERPIRYARCSPTVVFASAILGSIVLCGVGYVIWRSDGAPDRLSEQTKIIAYAAGDFFQVRDQCWPENNSVLPDISYCWIGAPNATEKFLIWGDSHARAMRDGIDQVAREHGLGGLIIWAAGCMPAFDIRKQESATGPRSDNACAAQDIAVKTMLAHRNSIKKVLLLGRWAYYTEGRGTGIDQQNLIRITSMADSPSSSTTAADQATIVARAKGATKSIYWSRCPRLKLIRAASYSKQCAEARRVFKMPLPSLALRHVPRSSAGRLGPMRRCAWRLRTAAPRYCPLTSCSVVVIRAAHGLPSDLRISTTIT
jgi:hypothetical protein